MTTEMLLKTRRSVRTEGFCVPRGSGDLNNTGHVLHSLSIPSGMKWEPDNLSEIARVTFVQ